MKIGEASALVLGGLVLGMSAQIPERAPFEITFAQIEASAGLPDLRAAPTGTVEARVMERPWSAMAPLSFLRIVRVNGKTGAQAFVFWGENVAPAFRPAGPDVRCRGRVCVKPMDLKEQLDWDTDAVRR